MIETLQHAGELARLIEIVREERPLSFLEIGSKFGGTLDAVARAMPLGSRVVSVDMPHGTRLWDKSSVSLQSVVANLASLGHDVRLIWGDSTDPHIIHKVNALGPFDLVFIDANHTMPFLRQDWENYGSKAIRLCVFHDISWYRPPDWQGVRIDVPEFWQEIKVGFRHEEIRLDHDRKDNGIGVLWL